MRIEIDKKAFLQAKARHGEQARETAALFILCGIDLAQALRSAGEERVRLIARLRRLIERERLKGVNRHWSYDLNRHIALKQALDRLKAGLREGSFPAPLAC